MQEARQLLMTRLDQLREEMVARQQNNRELEDRLSEGQQREKIVRETIKELEQLSVAMAESRGSQNGGDSSKRLPRLRPSLAIRRLLGEHAEGLTVGDCVRLLQGTVRSQATNKRNTISTTLYNMKKRGEVVHDATTGRYSLPQNRCGKGLGLLSGFPVSGEQQSEHEK